MLVFSEIPSSYVPALQRIEASSNRYALSPRSLSSSFKHYQHLGAFLDEQLVAFMLYRVVVDEAEVIHLVCDAAHQGKGYAHQLFKAVLAHAKEQQQVQQWHLEVRAHNHAALHLYRRLGFIETGRRKAYYQNREDAILMSLRYGVVL